MCPFLRGTVCTSGEKEKKFTMQTRVISTPNETYILQNKKIFIFKTCLSNISKQAAHCVMALPCSNKQLVA
jgi:hypothetical protein